MSKNVFLLGAGFTANFGAPLAREIWDDLFNKLPDANMRELLSQNQGDFEKFYGEVSKLDDTQAIKKVQAVLQEIFKKIDNQLSKRANSSNKISLSFTQGGSKVPYSFDMALQKFFTLIGEKCSQLIFTLNQDLFIERLFSEAQHKVKYLFCGDNNKTPSLSFLMTEIYKQGSDHKLQLNHSLQESDLWDVAESNCLRLVKLHGSYGWQERDSDWSMVVGVNKGKQIEANPLLLFYKNLFKKQLEECENVWTFGYGFNDSHINKEVSGALKKGSKLSIISGEKDLAEWKTKIGFRLNSKSDGDFSFDEFSHLRVYYPCYLKEELNGGENYQKFQEIIQDLEKC